ncbi:MAG TPA: C45 family autoproteolytic acyltransferase/hydrolase [Pirellulales bacterium]|nr:C45 family autoproteolytic acyltransferase/hydrolase [Pirellulales bacterium]
MSHRSALNLAVVAALASVGAVCLGLEAPASSAADFVPDPASVVRSGPAYRFPQAGWIVLHIEGAPYDRGYQHGQLLAGEIVDYIKTLADIKSDEGPAEAWRDMRMLSNALFLRRYDAEYLEEMKGIADGAAAAGAKFHGRKLDLVDIVAVNSAIEVEFLQSGLDASATGLEGKKFREPPDVQASDESDDDHCSAFAAVGPATADGGIVFGHITMFKLPFVRHFNVWLDVKPAEGHRVIMQGYPGAIMSGLDYYMNDAGLLVAETTLRQTTFDGDGLTVATRIRRALQYADSIDRAVEILNSSNNGLYTNEWLLADIKTNEIAMFELGTRQTKLWRSSKNQWPGGTKGFYWGCNNAKDVGVRQETVPSLGDKPANLVLRPSDRDLCWQRLFDSATGKGATGKIDVNFGFQAFTTPPLAAFPSCDAKFTTTKLAKELKSWALFGPPLGRIWEPTVEERSQYDTIAPLVPNDWALVGVDAPAKPSGDAKPAVDLKPFPDDEKPPFELDGAVYPPAWHGTLLAASDADTWLATAFADYEKIAAHEKALRYQVKHDKHGNEHSRRVKERLELDLFAPRSRWLTAVRRLGHDLPLNATKFDWRSNEWYDVAAGKGVFLLAALRRELGDGPFFSFMDDFGRGHAGKQTSTAEFRDAAEKAAGKSLSSVFDAWMKEKTDAALSDGHFWAIESYDPEPDKALIVYGTKHDVHLQREAATLLQRKIARRWSNVTVPVQSEDEVSEDDLRSHHLLLIGRPATNGVAARCQDEGELPVRFGRASFDLKGQTYAHARSAVVFAAANPFNDRYQVVVYAGLSAEATHHAIDHRDERHSPAAEIMLYPAGRRPRRLCIAVGP